MIINNSAAASTVTPTPISSGAAIAIIVGAVLLVCLLSWLSMLLQLYCYYSLDPNQRPVDVLSSNENDSCHLACLRCNLAIINSCCPTLDTKSGAIFNHNAMVIEQHSGGGNSMMLPTLAAAGMGGAMLAAATSRG